MHGLLLKTLQIFVQDTYGVETWARIAEHAALDGADFEAMLVYSPETFSAVLASVSSVLGKPTEAFLEDVGTYLVSHPNCERLRRLLRFGGVDFTEFLHSLDDLPERARLAVGDLRLPALELRECGDHELELDVIGPLAGFGHVLVGVMRAMGDDYGALVVLDHQGRRGAVETIHITVVKEAYSQGREFHLADNDTCDRRVTP